jgi:coenzyme PQQ biosynthesis protein PqqD
MLSMEDKVQRNERLPWRIIEGEAIVVNIDDEEVIHLNEVAAETWRLMDGTRTVGEIIERVDDIFDAARPTIEKDVVEFIEQLIDKNAAAAL